MEVIWGYLVTTHFQPTSARSAFPCWDEPNYKARFKIGVVRQRNYVALSNMPLDNTEDVSIFWGSGLIRSGVQICLQMMGIWHNGNPFYGLLY
ncbi:hypothetical protein OUZ56_013204 [Daphnia magna]|uniref:Aminopeptidase N-like N-terminal domain-containing protein n=1 Tax=Daphnia magna TaxID=35525 RepID=A0ABQ9Z565_9CRUS|nr:hypothetical protein OUZ56_013204 [Daphnia magna]